MRKTAATPVRKKAEVRRLKRKLSPAHIQRQREKARQARELKITLAYAKQKEGDKLQRREDKARLAVRKFRPRKADRGRYVMVGTKGGRNPQEKGHKGFLVFIDRRGKKKLQEDYNKGYLARKIGEMEIPILKTRNKARKEFLRARRVLMKSGRFVVKGSGHLKMKGQYDFNDKTVDKLAKAIKKTIVAQRSKRRFLITAMVLVRLPDGKEKAYTVEVPIDKADHISIEIGGIRNFVRQKFYAFMARELAFDGYVTSGSANHIRRLKENEGLDRDDWTKDGQVWEGHDYETVRILTIEYRIEQIK